MIHIIMNIWHKTTTAAKEDGQVYGKKKNLKTCPLIYPKQYANYQNQSIKTELALMKVNWVFEVGARNQMNECFKIKLCYSGTSICVDTATSEVYFDFLLMTQRLQSPQQKEVLHILQKLKLGIFRKYLDFCGLPLVLLQTSNSVRKASLQLLQQTFPTCFDLK